MFNRTVNMILILLMFISCSTLKLSEIIANDILDNFYNGGSRYAYSDTNIISSVEKAEEEITIDDTYFSNINIKEVKNMEQPEIVTMITSIIAGLYAVVKTIINLINKIKKPKQ